MNRHLHVVDTGNTSNATASSGAAMLPALQMLRSRSEEFFAHRLQAVFECVDDTFFDLADNAESNQLQTIYFDAMRVLRVNRSTIESTCLQVFRDAFHNARLVQLSAMNKDILETGLEDVELLENDELEENIAFEVMTKRADEHCKRGLQILCKRLDSLYSCAVTADNNPLGPESICSAFRQGTEKVDLDIRSRLVLLKLFERHVLSSMAELVQQSNQLLKELGVLPNIEMIKAGRGNAGVRNRQPGATGKTAADASQGAPLNEGQLVSKLSAILAEQQAATADQQRYAVQEDVLSAIGTLQQNGVGADSLMDAIDQQLSSLQQPAQISLTDRTVFTLVDLLFRQVCQTSALSPVMTAKMKDLELSIAKIALQDPAFFDREQHPARQLLNEVAQASIGFGDNDAAATNDPVYEKIHEVMDQLQKANVDDEQLPKLLEDFVSFVNKDQRRTRAVANRVLEEEDGRVRLNISHTMVKQKLEQRLLGMELPGIVVSFAEQGWGKVLFLAHLREGELSSHWNEALQVLEDIICFARSGGKIANDLDTTKLLENIQLQLEKAALDPYQIEFLVNGMRKLIDFRITGKEKGKPDPKLALKKVGILMLNIPGEPCNLEDQSADQQVEDNYLKEIASIKNGDWVEFITNDDITRRARFAGSIGPSGKTMVFVNRRGAKVIEGDCKQLAMELKKQRLVLLDNTPLFDQAIENVVDNIHSNLDQSRDIA